MSMRWPSRYIPPVCNGLWLFRYECSAWLWMFYGLLKFYWVKSPNQSCHNSMQFLVDDQWDQISFYFYRNQWTGVRGGELLQQDLCSYLNVADPRIGESNGTSPVLLPGKSHGQRSLVGSVHWVAKSRIQLSDFPFTFHFPALEKEMATHSSVFAWRIPGTGEPGGLPSMGSHRVGHNWSDLAAAAAETLILGVQAGSGFGKLESGFLEG